MKNPTPAVDGYVVLEEQQCQISSRSDLKRRNVRLFDSVKEGRPIKKENKTISDMRSVPDDVLSINIECVE